MDKGLIEWRQQLSGQFLFCLFDIMFTCCGVIRISSCSESKLKQVSTNSMVSQDCEIVFSQSVQNLGVLLDESLSVEMPVNQLHEVWHFQLCRISKICSFLTADVANTLFAAFILSCLDYCNSLSAGLPEHKLTKFLRIQNSAASLSFINLDRIYYCTMPRAVYSWRYIYMHFNLSFVNLDRMYYCSA